MSEDQRLGVGSNIAAAKRTLQKCTYNPGSTCQEHCCSKAAYNFGAAVKLKSLHAKQT
jgi:hypothetical protein